jgi:hypothetical protein
LLALASLEKPSMVSTCPLGQAASTTHPIAGGVFLRAVNVGLGSIMIALQGLRDLAAINVITAQKLLDASPNQAMSRRAMSASMRGKSTDARAHRDPLRLHHEDDLILAGAT